MSELTWSHLSILQKEVFTILENSFSQNRLSHAYLFEGYRGTKKKATAELFAMRLLCLHPSIDSRPCGTCPSCKNASEDVHPNLFWIRPDGETIKKDQMKKILAEFSKTALLHQPRICVIVDAHKMNSESANTMLKFMEEPTADAYFILITDQVDAMIKTILSRTQVLHFKPIARQILTKELRAIGVSERLCLLIPEYTNDFDSAVELANHPMYIEMVDFANTLFIKALAKKESLLLLSKAKKELILSSNETFDFFITILLVLQKDVYHMKKHLPSLVVDTIDIELITQLAKRSSQAMIEELLQQMLELKSRLRYHINQSLAFDNLIMHLERGLQYGI